MLNKMLSSIGIGSAKVDAQLHKRSYRAGEEVTGIVLVVGGKVEQKIDQIYLSVDTEYEKEQDDKKYRVKTSIDKFRVVDSFVIQPGERQEIPFSFTLPVDTPLSLKRNKVWLSTGLDIKMAVDPGDKDYIEVKPLEEVDAVLQAVKSLGFSLREAENKQASRRLRGRLPFIQEFEFVPGSGAFRGLLDELELVFFPSSNGQVEVIMQIDRKARGLSGLLAEAFDRDESHVRFHVSQSDIPHIQTTIEGIIEQHAR